VNVDGRASRSDDVTQIDSSAMSCHSRNDARSGPDETGEALLALVAAIADHRRRMARLMRGLVELSDDADHGLTALLQASDDRLGGLCRQLEMYVSATAVIDVPPVEPTPYVST
jgi:hypothetical protein